MNREIKFRAWDRRISKMLKTWVMDFRASSDYIMVQNEWPNNRGPAEQAWGNTMEHIEIMQFTGLKDKNGKEIYEGDVCRFFWNPILNQPSELFEAELPVTYYTGWGCFVFHWQSKKMKKKQRELFEDYGREEIYVAIGSPIMYGEGIEVIGNVHENPELLTP